MMGVWERSIPALENFCNFSVKITYFYAYFGQNSYFKAITHQLKAFKISLNVLNNDDIFATKGDSNPQPLGIVMRDF